MSEKFTTLQKLVGFGLDGILTAQTSTIAVNPVFGSANPIALDVFVMMPFDTTLASVYGTIRDACNSLNLKVARGDDLFTANHVMTDIWSSIFSTKAVIADCTSRNPNVFYEMGIAHAVGKPVVLVTRDANDVPFDLRHMRYIVFSDTAEGRAHLEVQLKSALCETLKLPADKPA